MQGLYPIIRRKRRPLAPPDDYHLPGSIVPNSASVAAVVPFPPLLPQQRFQRGGRLWKHRT
jgi:hypothetical protein